MVVICTLWFVQLPLFIMLGQTIDKPIDYVTGIGNTLRIRGHSVLRGRLINFAATL